MANDDLPGLRSHDYFRGHYSDRVRPRPSGANLDFFIGPSLIRTRERSADFHLRSSSIFLAVSTYFTVSLIFWYTGLVPDLATLRNRTRGSGAKIYGLFSLGWTGTHRQWSPLRGCLSLPGRPGHSLSHIRAQRCLLGFRPVHHSRLSQHDLPPLLRGRRHSLRSGHGSYPAHTPAERFFSTST